MYENSTTYTWWDIEDSVGPLAAQAVDRWESLGLPKDATENLAVLRVWATDEGTTAYTISLLYGDTEVYTAEGCIKISGVSHRVATKAIESAIIEGAVDLVGEDVTENLTEGLLGWLRQQ